MIFIKIKIKCFSFSHQKNYNNWQNLLEQNSIHKFFQRDLNKSFFFKIITEQLIF